MLLFLFRNVCSIYFMTYIVQKMEKILILWKNLFSSYTYCSFCLWIFDFQLNMYY